MKSKSALVVVDVQNDFCPGGSLPVEDGDRVVPALNRYIELFVKSGQAVYASRDWHPSKTGHFREYGGKWPAHCVQGTRGAAFHPALKLPEDAVIVTKGSGPDEDGYSAFQGRDDRGRPLAQSLRDAGVRRVFVGGLATDYCVKETVNDALKEGFEVVLLLDAVKGVDVAPGDSQRAIEEMIRSGARPGTAEAVQFA